MITKKWVEERLVGPERLIDTLNKQDKKDGDDILVLKKEVGYTIRSFTSMLDPLPNLSRPNVSVHERINAICAYLGIVIVKESKQEKIVAKKIGKDKAK